jgi:hypothetical protein
LRPFYAALARLSLALVPLCVVGCQNNTQRDLIARDRRAQEDELYAMGDYITQYQQLVCQYRSENATLRRQLATTRAGTSNVGEPQLMPQRGLTYPAPRNAPRTNTPAPGPETPSPSTPKLDLPDVPPLNQGTSVPEAESLATHAVLASYNEPAAGSAVQSDAPPEVPPNATGKRPSAAPRDSSPDVLLSGEVIQNSGGGPRLLVDVEAFDQSGQIVKFDGEVSLVLVTSDGQGGQRNAAKWDFCADDVRSAICADSSKSTMRFRIALPTNAAIGDASELWVRLVPMDGRKILSHAALDLSRPGTFSSRTDKLWPSEESVIAASYVEDSREVAANERAAAVNESTWATAQPGKPAIPPQDVDRPNSSWRASNEVIPVAANSATFKAPPHESVRSSSAPTKSSSDAPPSEVAEKPSWTPDRPGTSVRVSRPSWSATR